MSSEENTSDFQKRWVKLNVGGTTFLTTLARYPGSVLYRLCQEDSDLKTDRDESGAYLIERNPNYFPPILDFLRHGELIMDAHVAEEGVLKEAEFFGLPDLVRLVQLKIQEKLKARMVELKMVEEWRLEEKLKLEQKLGLQRQPKMKVVRTAYHLHHDANVGYRMLGYLELQFKADWKLDEMINLPTDKGTIVIMSTERPE